MYFCKEHGMVFPKKIQTGYLGATLGAGLGNTFSDFLGGVGATNMDLAFGSAIGCIVEGTRPFFIEVQALVTRTVFGYPQRKASGFDLNRLQVLTAVVTKRANVNLSNQDVKQC